MVVAMDMVYAITIRVYVNVMMSIMEQLIVALVLPIDTITPYAHVCFRKML